MASNQRKIDDQRRKEFFEALKKAKEIDVTSYGMSSALDDLFSLEFEGRTENYRPIDIFSDEELSRIYKEPRPYNYFLINTGKASRFFKKPVLYKGDPLDKK